MAPLAGDRRQAFVVGSAGYSYLKGTANEVKALDGVSMSLPAGSITALVGRTGSGKSTILQLLDGLAFPSAGCVMALGEDTVAKSTDLRRLRMKAPLAIQRPESALFEVYAGDDVAFGPRNQGLSGKALVERVKSAMEKLGLPFETYRDRGTRGLSGGEKRRLALAGILALEPEALLLDEPTSALDPATKAQVLDLVRSLAASGRTVVFATHSMEEAAMADSVAVIAEGRLAAFGSPAELFYDLYDPAWGIGRPFACELAQELRRLGSPLAPGARPLDTASLVEALHAATRSVRGDAGGALDAGGRP
jgi:energy-coupling factor transport system ATP-binding protein